MNWCKVALFNDNNCPGRLKYGGPVNVTIDSGNCVINCSSIMFMFVPMLPTIVLQVLLAVVLAGLLVLLVTTCIKFTKGPFNTAALKAQLRSLQIKFVTAALINPEFERQEMEKLQNKIKTSRSQVAISGDHDLKLLFASNCQYIQSELDNTELDNRSSWIKFRELMSGFNHLYFRK